MKNVKLVFERDKGIIPKLIRWFTKSKYNHIAILYDSDDWGGPWVAEAAMKGVRTIPEKNRKWKAVVTPLYPEIIQHTKEVGHYIGEKYELKALFVFAWIIAMWRWFKIKVKKPHWKCKDQICSEFVARIVKKKLSEKVTDPQWTSPEELLVLFKANPDLFLVKES